MLTDRGQACTVAAEQAAADVVQQWRDQLPDERFDRVREALEQVAPPGRLGPAW